VIRSLITGALLALVSQERVVHSLHGYVIDAQTGSPVRRALVVASSPDGNRVNASSDAEGRFELRELVAGKYTLSASKPGYLTSVYGQARHGGPGIPIDVPGQIADAAVKMTIFRGGVIPGRIVDERGEPVPLAQVRALQYKYNAAGRQLSLASAQGSSRTTDDLGSFRLYGLTPGRYFVVATGPVVPSIPLTPGVDVRLPLTTYYPNTADAASAQPILVEAGKDTPPITIALGASPPVRVRGHVIRSTGEPFAGSIEVTPNENHAVMLATSSLMRPDGSFELPRMIPGSYQITAHERVTNSSRVPEAGHAIVNVGTEDIDDVLIVTGKAGIARGRVVTDTGSVPSGGVLQLSVATVGASGRDRVWRSNGPAPVKNDWSFEVDGLVGTHMFQIVSPNQQWIVHSVRTNGQDVTDTGLSFGPNDVVDDLVIVVTRTSNELSGTVTDATGRKTSDAWVIVFPADSSLWKSTRWIRATQPDRRGAFRVEALPASDSYLVIAVPYNAIDDGEWSDPNMLNELQGRAQPIALGAAEKKTINLRLSMP
jgi:hypothetical protein